MDVFALDDHLLAQYTGFARSFTRIRSAELQQEVNRLYAGRRFWPEPLLQLNPHYEGGGSIRSLVGERGLVEDCARIFIDRRAAPDATGRETRCDREPAARGELRAGAPGRAQRLARVEESAPGPLRLVPRPDLVPSLPSCSCRESESPPPCRVRAKRWPASK